MPTSPVTIRAMLDHEEKFLFKEEILHLSNALDDPGSLDNVEDLLTDVITSPRFDSEVFTLERSLQVMLGARAGTTLVGLLTVAPEVFEEVAEVRIQPEVHERLVAWRARFGLAIDNALNFLNNPDGIQGHNFSTQVAHVEERRVLQGRLTMVRYNNEPQFFVADAAVFLGLVTDIMERLGPYLEPDSVDEESLTRLREAVQLIERKTDRRAPSRAATAVRQLYLAATGQNRGKTTASLGLVDGFRRRGYRTGFIKPVGQRTVIEDGAAGRRGRRPDEGDLRPPRAVPGDEPGPHPARLHQGVHRGRRWSRTWAPGSARRTRTFADHDMLVIEGTGHAGVGAVIGLSNAVVAADARGAGGDRVRGRRRAGRSTRSCSTPRTSRAHGVPVAGAIVNKVRVDEQPGIEETLRRGLARHGIPLLGVLPYRPILSNPTLGMVLEGVRGRVICPGRDLDRVIDGVAIGAMEPHHMLARIGPGTLVIVPGDREDVIVTLTAAHLAQSQRGTEVAALLDETPGAVEAGPEGAADRHGPDRRLRAAARGPRRHPRGRTCSRRSSTRTRTRSPPRSTTCWSRPTRPTREQDRADQGAGLGVPQMDRFLEAATEARFD